MWFVLLLYILYFIHIFISLQYLSEHYTWLRVMVTPINGVNSWEWMSHPKREWLLWQEFHSTFGVNFTPQFLLCTACSAIFISYSFYIPSTDKAIVKRTNAPTSTTTFSSSIVPLVCSYQGSCKILLISTFSLETTFIVDSLIIITRTATHKCAYTLTITVRSCF